MNLDEIQRRSRDLFRLEAADLLRELEAALLALESDPSSHSLIARAFRVMHTLKGSGATSGFQELSDFVHRVEDVFNAAREDRLTITPAIVDLTLRLADAIARHLAAAPEHAAAILEAARGDLTALLQFLPEGGPRCNDVRATPGEVAPGSPTGAAALPCYRIRFRPSANLFRSGGDPGMFLDDLRALGTCSITVDTERLPALAELDPESSYLAWEIELTTAAGENAIRDVFAFVEGECGLEISSSPAAPATLAPAAAIATDSAEPWLIEFQATRTALAAPDALEALKRDLASFGPLERLSVPASSGPSDAPAVWRFRLHTSSGAEAIRSAFVFLPDLAPRIRRETAPSPPARPAHSAPAEPRTAPVTSAPSAAVSPRAGQDTLRVSADRLDRLVDLVGELVILRSQVSTVCAALPDLPTALQGAAESLHSLSTEMRDVILNIRMMPIEQTFAKFRRLVRDLARELGKEVDLVIEGGETEMDKTVLDALADPLVHLVRNSLDHGLEPAADRLRSGKPARGTLTLRAEQRGDRVLVSVRDDGRGLDSARIRAKAIRQRLLAPDATAGEAELHQMVFLPGFSTADTVSQVSGRGVGLDVVRRQVEQLRGKVEVRSEAGRGAEFRLSLPLTLAIIDGLMVEVDGDRYILPLAAARETIELPRAERTAGNGRNLVELRGQHVPYVRLREIFGFTGTEAPDPERVVIVELEEQRVGLVVDRVVGNHQTVLKSLGWISRRVAVFSGATVLGDGRIALIIDVPALLAHHRSSRQAGGDLSV